MYNQITTKYQKSNLTLLVHGFSMMYCVRY